MVITWLHFRTQPHKQAEILSAVDQLVVHMLRARGCARGRVLSDLEDSNAFLIVSEWASLDDVNAFLASREFRIFRGIRMLLRGQPTFVLDEVRHRVTRLLT